jgi:hypothetical protein
VPSSRTIRIGKQRLPIRCFLHFASHALGRSSRDLIQSACRRHQHLCEGNSHAHSTASVAGATSAALKTNPRHEHSMDTEPPPTFRPTTPVKHARRRPWLVHQEHATMGDKIFSSLYKYGVRLHCWPDPCRAKRRHVMGVDARGWIDGGLTDFSSQCRLIKGLVSE